MCCKHCEKFGETAVLFEDTVSASNTNQRTQSDTCSYCDPYRTSRSKPQCALHREVPALVAALKAYRAAVHAGIDADPELWRRAELLGDAAIARLEGRQS